VDPASGVVTLGGNGAGHGGVASWLTSRPAPDTAAPCPRDPPPGGGGSGGTGAGGGSGAAGGGGAGGVAGASGAGGGGAGTGGGTPSDTTGPIVALPASNKTITASKIGSFGFGVGPFAEDTTGVVAIKSAPLSASAAQPGTKPKKLVLKLGTKPFQAKAGQKLVLKFKLSRKNLRLLVGRRKIRLVARVTARDKLGNATTRTFKFTLKSPTKRRG
jgi:hypothetical protein